MRFVPLNGHLDTLRSRSRVAYPFSLLGYNLKNAKLLSPDASLPLKTKEEHNMRQYL
jgi:hypothetical protein